MDVPPNQFHIAGDLLTAPPQLRPAETAPVELAPDPPRRRRRRGRGLVPLLAAGVVGGVLLGGRASAEDGRVAAAAAMAAGEPAQAVSLDEAVAGRSGFLMLLDPGGSSSAAHDGQVARIAWAQQLAAAGKVDSAVAVLALVGQPSLAGAAEQARATILVNAAAQAVKAGNAQLALLRLAEADDGNIPATTQQAIATLRAADEVAAAADLVRSGRAPDALALLDDATAHGAAGTAASAYPATLLAAARAELPLADFVEAATTLQRLAGTYASSAEAATARRLLAAAQPVAGTLVDSAGHGAAGRVRLSTHFTQLNGGGYVTGGPFYTSNTDGDGNFTITGVPVGGPYVLEYFRDGNWMTLVDPRTDQPADPVTVAPLQPQDLTFIVLPG